LMLKPPLTAGLAESTLRPRRAGLRRPAVDTLGE
jgi:hypothetical protein